ncbi:MAG: hypothetical protein M1821_007788 [Bathelium mastoideum]|nr:MAG: hypothetical protein M1821_007788 [Bathelium mastoideum]
MEVTIAYKSCEQKPNPHPLTGPGLLICQTEYTTEDVCDCDKPTLSQTKKSFPQSDKRLKAMYGELPNVLQWTRATKAEVNIIQNVVNAAGNGQELFKRILEASNLEKHADEFARATTHEKGDDQAAVQQGWLPDCLDAEGRRLFSFACEHSSLILKGKEALSRVEEGLKDLQKVAKAMEAGSFVKFPSRHR